MGTLYDQPPRKFRSVTLDGLAAFVAALQGVAEARGVELRDVIAAAAVLETKRASDLAVNDGDAHDEQMAGVGRALEAIAEALDRQASCVGDLAEPLDRQASYVVDIAEALDRQASCVGDLADHLMKGA